MTFLGIAKMRQKFFLGDLVRIGDLPVGMNHFKSNCEAIILYSYWEQYGDHSPNAAKLYSVYLLKKKGACAWYEENQLTLLESDRFDLLPKHHSARMIWEAKKARDI